MRFRSGGGGRCFAVAAAAAEVHRWSQLLNCVGEISGNDGGECRWAIAATSANLVVVLLSCSVDTTTTTTVANLWLNCEVCYY